ncbi:hypothetical protein ACFLUS_05315 [Chloroflexota bacterium]
MITEVITMFWSSSKRKGKERLFKQWVGHGDLSPEQAQLDLLAEEQAEKSQLADDETQGRKIRDYSTLSERNGGITLPVRYVVILLSIIAVLVIALSVLVTVLIIRS